MFIHVGFAKCGSTAFQSALRCGGGVLYPSAGTFRSDSEHISLPLYLKGIDGWTRQFITDDWVQAQHELMMLEISKSDQTVVLSSERLAVLDPSEIRRLKEIFSGYDVEIIVIRRDKQKFLDSTWRHAVFNDDYPVDYKSFLVLAENFDFSAILPGFERYFPVHQFNLDDEDFEEDMKALIGAQFTFRITNVGVPWVLADLLQKQHALIGTALFKEIFPEQVKRKMLLMMTRIQPPVIDPFNVPLF